MESKSVRTLVLMVGLVTMGWGYPTGPGPYHLASGDINRDGFDDVVVVCRGELLLPSEKRPANDTVTVYFTKGSKELVERREYSVGFGPYTALVRDLDGDGLLDLAVVNFQANDGRHLSILWGTRESPYLGEAEAVAIPGDHVYDKQRTAGGEPVYPVPGLTSIAALRPARAGAGGGGVVDLVAVAWSSDFFVVMRNQGRRRFAMTLYPLPPGPRDVAVADLNGDGREDLAFTIYSANLVEVWHGVKGGRFQKGQVFYSQGHTPYHLKAGDLDGDGWADLVVGNRGPSDNVAVFRNEKGRFRFAGSWRPGTAKKGETTADEIRDVLLHDVDGDGKLDLLAACHVSHKVVQWAGTGRGEFGKAFGAARTRVFPGQGPRTLLPVGGRIAVGLFDSNELQWLEW
jgi:hypothetical protein